MLALKTAGGGSSGSIAETDARAPAPSVQPLACRSRRRAKPASRSALRSSRSSRPIWKRSAGPPGRHVVARPVGGAVEGDDEALEAAPGKAHAEQLEPVEHGRDRLVRQPASGSTENRPVEPLKSRRQMAWPGSLSSAGCRTAVDLRPRREPARHVERLALVLLEAQAQGAQAAQGEEHVLRPGADRHGVEGRAQAPPAALVGRDEAEQEVGAAAQVFGAGLDGEVDAALVRREERAASPRCCP